MGEQSLTEQYPHFLTIREGEYNNNRAPLYFALVAIEYKGATFKVRKNLLKPDERNKEYPADFAGLYRSIHEPLVKEWIERG